MHASRLLAAQQCLVHRATNFLVIDLSLEARFFEALT
jgi:hypothetical protein